VQCNNRNVLPLLWAHFQRVIDSADLQARTKRFNLLLLMRRSRLEGHCSRYEEESAAIALGRKRDLLLMTYKAFFANLQGRAVAKSWTKLNALGLPKPVVRSKPVVVAIPAIPEPKLLLLSSVTAPGPNVCGTMSRKSLDGKL
jgi:hypothetical protein